MIDSVRAAVLTQARLKAHEAPVGWLLCHGLAAGQVWERHTHITFGEAGLVEDYRADELWAVWAATLQGVQLYVFPLDGAAMRKRVMAALVVAHLRTRGDLTLIPEALVYRRAA